jgi:hypothetical protein
LPISFLPNRVDDKKKEDLRKKTKNMFVIYDMHVRFTLCDLFEDIDFVDEVLREIN